MPELLLQSSFSNFWTLIAAGGPISNLVLLVLLAFSIFSWSIIVKKMRVYREVERQSDEFHAEFQSRSSLSEIYQQCEHYPLAPLAGVYKSGYEELTHRVRAAQADGELAAGRERQLVQSSLSSLERTLRKAAMAEMLELEKQLSWLATTGAVTPFIGLFGTVVGIINAFQGLGDATAATTIQAVAPGISEALVATAAGLFAAIPAVIGYNHYISKLRQFGTEMDDFSVELMNLIERSFT